MDAVIINQIMILFIIMIVGVLGAKLKIIDDNLSKGLSNLLINIALPCLILSTFDFSFSKKMAYNSALIIIITFSVLIFSILLSKVLYLKYEKKEQQVLRFLTIFSNCGFMGFPVVSSIYGKEGLFYTSMYNIVFNLVIWTYGLYLFSGKKDINSIKRLFINPAMVSTFTGILLFLFSIKLPGPIQGTLSMIGSMTVPISMLVVGASLSNIKFIDMASGFKIYYVSFLRLLFIPVILILVLKQFSIPNIIMGSVVILTAMPAATLSVIFAEANGGDVKLASKIIFISTVLSAVTIPIIILLL
ncbi:MAG: AEC family transporter [Bacillota bacterium]|nr:AEC family transporter [Bacillota bacterium]